MTTRYVRCAVCDQRQAEIEALETLWWDEVLTGLSEAGFDTDNPDEQWQIALGGLMGCGFESHEAVAIILKHRNEPAPTN